MDLRIPGQQEEPVGRHNLFAAGRLHQWQIDLAYECALVNSCHTGVRRKRNNGCVSVYGTPSNISATEWMFNYVSTEIYRLGFRKSESFRTGMCYGVRVKLQDLRRNIEREYEGKPGLVLFRNELQRAKD